MSTTRSRAVGGLIISAAAATLLAWSLTGPTRPARADPPHGGNPPGKGGGGGGGGNSDTVPPDPVSDLIASPAALGTVFLEWTAVGDDGGDGDCTQAAGYDIRYASSPIVTDADFEAAIQVLDSPTPAPCGTLETFCLDDLAPGMIYDVAVKVLDEAGNVSAVSNVATADSGATLGTTVHAGQLTASWTIVGPRKRLGRALVWVEDEFGTPVEGAVVIGDFTGCASEMGFSAVTDCTGFAVIDSKRGVNCTVNSNCCFVFTLVGIEHDTLAYAPADDVDTCKAFPCYVAGLICPACQ